jgi:hypothetical protein
LTEREKALSRINKGGSVMDTKKTIVNETSAKIARLNDAVRDNAFNYVTTRGILSLSPEAVSEIFVRVQNFKEFNEDNDPYGEHDFGSFTVSGVKIFWKIDYYDEALKGWCDPLSPDCNRVLTIMRADEY